MSKPYSFSIAYPSLEKDVIRFMSKRMDYTSDLEKANFIVFTGGADVDPRLYADKPIQETSFNEQRDKAESIVYQKYHKSKSFIGICRGFQLLHVLNGGYLRQHVDNHTSGTHTVFFNGREYTTNSVHHQMLISSGRTQIIGRAQKATYFKSSENKKHPIPMDDLDPEIGIINGRHFGVQFHPEWCTKSEELFWESLNYWRQVNYGDKI
jgi:gamma-glutamyl-gamma-aminobutyrate hydrolase PuuD